MGRKGGTTMEKWASGIRIRQRQADQKLPRGRKGGVGSRWGFRCFGFDSIALSFLQTLMQKELSDIALVFLCERMWWKIRIRSEDNIYTMYT